MSSVLCPHCQNPLPPDFGLVSCAHCGASVMLDENGDISQSQSQSASEAADGLIESAEVLAPEFEMGSLFEEALSPQFESLEFGDGEEGLEEPQNETPSEANPSDPSGLKYESEQAHEDEELDFDARLDSPKPLEDLSDLADFGNSELSQASEGNLYYSICIEGIDTAEMRSALKAELQDPKFMWNVEQLLREIRAGTLRLAHVPSVKASLLVQRLMRSSFSVTWTQHLLQAEANFEET